MPLRLRPADRADGPFLTEMLVAAAFWRPDGPVGDMPTVLARPELARYVAGWPLAGELGVVAEAAGRAVGTALLSALTTAAREHRYESVSLSVEPDNPARRLYERLEFRVVDADEGSVTMQLHL